MAEESKESLEEKKQMIDIYKIRIEEYDRNFYSLRDVEWRTAIQFMTGYIAIGLAFNQIKPNNCPAYLLPVVGIGLVVSLFIVFVYFRYRIHQRLRWARDRRSDFGKKLHGLHPATKLAIEDSYDLPGAYWYTFLTQILVHFLAVAAIIAFIAARWFGLVQ